MDNRNIKEDKNMALVKMNLKEFLKGTRNSYHIEISQGNNDNIVFFGTYKELKESDFFKENELEIVTSWDVVELDNGKMDIGIMI